jgi:D-alanyl-D-alanine carboxypeptidase (penicillin-binding protein 5/6)
MLLSRRYLLILLLMSAFTGSTINADNALPAPASPIMQTQGNNPFASYMVPSEPDLKAKSFVLMDARSGAVLASKNGNLRLQPASLTKLMSLYIVFGELASGRIHLDDKVTISEKAWKTGGSRMFIKVGSQVAVSDLIQGVIVQSGNDATVAMADYLGGTTDGFVQMMDQQAIALGMKDSHFSDPTGLPSPDHLVTSYDLALLARAIVTQYPQYYHYFGEKWFTWNGIRQPNRNRLLWRNIGVDGLKTGHTEDAGYCLISSALQNNTRFVSIMMGTPSNTGLGHKTMFDKNGFNRIRFHRILSR